MEFKYGNLIFSSNFDSGNLLNVERVVCMDENFQNQLSDSNKPDYEFNIWTKSDCYGTEFENGNRTWFHFSVKGYTPGRTIKITLKNLNRQQRLYSQGYCPLYKTEVLNCESSKWLRIRSRPIWETNDNNFQLTFVHRFCESKHSVTYFAFCYPWSYNDCQKQLEDLDDKFNNIQSLSCDKLSMMDSNTIYYHRELLTYSLNNRRIDLLTITDLSGLQRQREELFDSKLFPLSNCRPWVFKNKKVFVVTSRVHPGETPASHVFNGFLEFILRKDDSRSFQLRKKFIFKLIPLLNPDGVCLGHYRTDTRGVNLNRVYLYPDFKLHPSIYAAKSLIAYHHIVNSEETFNVIDNIKLNIFGKLRSPISEIDQEKIATSPVFLSTSNESIEQQNLKNSKEIEISFNEELSDEKDETYFKDSQEISLVNNLKKDIFDYPITNDYYEVTVDPGSQKIDLISNNMMNVNVSNEMQRNLDNRDICSISVKNPVINFSISDVMKSDNSKSLYKCANKTSESYNSLNKFLKSDKSVKEQQCNFRNFSECSQGNNLHFVKPCKKLHSSMIPLPLKPAIVSMKFSSKKLNKISMNSSRLTKMKNDLQVKDEYNSESKLGNEGSDEDSEKEYMTEPDVLKYSTHLSDPSLLNITPEKSGIAFYVDLHGHCSKRGCFIYGNCLESENEMIENILYPKLISLNSPHFDFSGCNFSFKNMYTRDKRDGSSKEGAGRVAMWKHLGIIHSYTLECNYNTGRIINMVPQIVKEDGKSSPILLETSNFLAPKYTTYHFEDVGKAMAISALDMLNMNPLSRIPFTEYNSLNNLRDYLKKYLSNQKLGMRTLYNYKSRSVTRSNKNQTGISNNIKPYLINSESRHINYSKNSIPLNDLRKSQSSQIHRLPNQKFTIINKLPPKGSFPNEGVLNSCPVNLLDKERISECNKLNVTPIVNKESEIYVKSPHLNANFSISKFERLENGKSFVKQPMLESDQFFCESSIVSNDKFDEHFQLNQRKSAKLDDMKYNENKPLLPLRRNSIANCYLQSHGKDSYFADKEKIEKIGKIFSDKKPVENTASYFKTYTFNCTNKSNGVKSEELGKLMSYSESNIHF